LLARLSPDGEAGYLKDDHFVASHIIGAHAGLSRRSSEAKADLRWQPVRSSLGEGGFRCPVNVTGSARFSYWFLGSQYVMKRESVGIVMIAIFLYVVMTISGAVERSVAVKVGSHYSPAFAAKIQELSNWKAELQKTDPQAAERASAMILFARWGARALIAILVTVFMLEINKFGARRRKVIADEQQKT
jgi:hypothetical protein